MATLLAPANCHADLAGSTVLLESFFPNLTRLEESWGPESVVDPGVEFPVVFQDGGRPDGEIVWSSDVFPSQIHLNHLASNNDLGGADFNGFVYTFSDLNGTISDVTLNAASTLTPTQYWHNTNQVFVDVEGIGIIGSGISTILDVTVVPEPSGMTALLLGFAVLLGGRSRKS